MGRRPGAIYEDPEFASFAPQSSARSQPASQGRWYQSLLRRQYHKTFPSLLIYFFVIFSVYWVYKYSWMQSHAQSDFSVTTMEKIMLRHATEDDGQSGTSEDGSTIVDSAGSEIGYRVSEGSDSQTDGIQIYNDGGAAEDGGERIIGSIDGLSRGVRKDSGGNGGREKDGGKKGEGESYGAGFKNKYSRKLSVGEDGDQNGSSERSGEESKVKKLGGPGDVYEDIDSVDSVDIDDDDKQVGNVDGGLGVIVELSGNEGSGTAVVAGGQVGGLGPEVNRKVGGGLVGNEGSSGKYGGSRVIGRQLTNNVGNYEIEVQDVTDSDGLVVSGDRGRQKDVRETRVQRGGGKFGVLGIDDNKIGGQLVSSKGGDSESDMEIGDRGQIIGLEGGKGYIDNDGNQLARREGDDNKDQFRMNASDVEHCLSFEANWSKCWRKWGAAVLTICTFTIVIFCCMNFVCWFIYLIIVLVILTLYVLRFIMKVI